MTAFQPNPENERPYDEMSGGANRYPDDWFASGVDSAESADESLRRQKRRPTGVAGVQPDDSSLDRHWNVTQDRLTPEERQARISDAQRGRELARKVFAHTQTTNSSSPGHVSSSPSTANGHQALVEASWDEIEERIARQT